MPLDPFMQQMMRSGSMSFPGLSEEEQRILFQQMLQSRAGARAPADPFEERMAGSGAFGMAPSFEEYPLDQPIYRSDVSGPMGYEQPSPIGLAPEFNQEEYDRDVLAGVMAESPLFPSAGFETVPGAHAGAMDPMSTAVGGRGPEPLAGRIEDALGRGPTMGQPMPEYDMAPMEARGTMGPDDYDIEFAEMNLQPGAGGAQMPPPYSPGPLASGEPLPSEMAGMAGPSIGRGAVMSVDNAILRAQRKWLQTHKPENYANAAEYKQAMVDDGIVNPFSGNYVSQKLGKDMGVSPAPERTDVVGRAQQAATSKKREINRVAFEEVLARFGGEMSLYDKWFYDQPEGERPQDWTEALQATAGVGQGAGGGAGGRPVGYGTVLADYEEPMDPGLEELMSLEQAPVAGVKPFSFADVPPRGVMSLPPEEMMSMELEGVKPLLDYVPRGFVAPWSEAYTGRKAGAPIEALNRFIPSWEDPERMRPPVAGEATVSQGVWGDVAADPFNIPPGTDIPAPMDMPATQWYLEDPATTITPMASMQFPGPGDIQMGPRPTLTGPSLEDIQMGPRPQEIPVEGMETVSGQQRATIGEMFQDPTMDTAPSGLFTEDQTLTNVQSLPAEPSLMEDTTNSMGEAQETRKRRESRGYQEFLRRKREEFLFAPGFEMGGPAVWPEMEFYQKPIELGMPTIGESPRRRRRQKKLTRSQRERLQGLRDRSPRERLLGMAQGGNARMLPPSEF